MTPVRFTTGIPHSRVTQNEQPLDDDDEVSEIIVRFRATNDEQSETIARLFNYHRNDTGDLKSIRCLYMPTKKYRTAIILVYGSRVASDIFFNRVVTDKSFHSKKILHSMLFNHL